VPHHGWSAQTTCRFFFRFVGVIYAVVLALVAIAVWEVFKDAAPVEHEAALALYVYRDARTPRAARTEIHQEANLVQVVIKASGPQWQRESESKPRDSLENLCTASQNISRHHGEAAWSRGLREPQSS